MGTHFDFFRKQLTLDLAHEEDARWRTNRIEMPAWVIGPSVSREDTTLLRCADLENHVDMKPWSQRTDVPGWPNDIQLVANLHGQHWTGYVFNTFDQMGNRLEWLARRMEGRSILAFLPAWDGRYYFDCPAYQPAPQLGGADGLRKLVARAHKLGVHVVPMLGANAGNTAYMEKAGLGHTILRNEYGIPQYCDWVDWDSDLSTEGHTMMANTGHPDFQNHLLERSSYLVNEFGVDGIFLDISGCWRNCSDFSPYEGTLACHPIARHAHERPPNRCPGRDAPGNNTSERTAATHRSDPAARTPQRTNRMYSTRDRSQTRPSVEQGRAFGELVSKWTGFKQGLSACLGCERTHGAGNGRTAIRYVALPLQPHRRVIPYLSGDAAAALQKTGRPYLARLVPAGPQ